LGPPIVFIPGRRIRHWLVTGFSQSQGCLFVICTLLAAAPVSAQTSQMRINDPEIVVTARREGERLDSVPGSVAALSGDQMQNLDITNFVDISKLVPGLTFAVQTPAATPDIFLRGVRSTVIAGTPSIPFYLNDASFHPLGMLRTTIYDVDQVEVLRGPQGTSRGEASIAGAITVTTRKPDLDEIGGRFIGEAGEGRRRILQGALNLPIVEDKLGVRLAGSIDENAVNRVRSVNNPLRPFVRYRSFRVSARFEPGPTFRVDAMFQRTIQRSRFNFPVAGPGSPGVPADAIPANFNGPPITVHDFLAVQETPNRNRRSDDIVTVNAKWDVLGHSLTYNFGIEDSDGFTKTSIDTANMLIGYDPLATLLFKKGADYHSHELRLSSMREAGKFLNYDFGFHWRRLRSHSPYSSPLFALSGATGNPFVASSMPSPFVNPQAVERYSLAADIELRGYQKIYSFYGNVLLNITDRTELSGGIRWLHNRGNSTNALTIRETFFAAFPRPGGDCGAIGNPGIVTSSVYPEVCDFALPERPQPAQRALQKGSPVIYNVMLTQRFSPNLLAYVSVGSSWRGVFPSTSIGLPDSLFFADPEKATAYEFGVKAGLGRWLRVDTAVFQIDYDAQSVQIGSFPYYSQVDGSVRNTNMNYFYSLDSRIRGIEASLSIKPTSRFSASANLSYVKTTSRGGTVPCENNAVPLTPANPVNFCLSEKGETLNSAPPFQANLSGEYTVPIGQLDAYVRLLMIHRGKNPNVGTSDNRSKSYAQFDLFGGITHSKGGWELGFYAKNLFNNTIQLTSETDLSAPLGLGEVFGPSGYNGVTTTSPREIGVVLRFGFGSR